MARETREKENRIVLGSVWMLSESTFTAEDHREMRESIPNVEIVGYLAILTKRTAHAELDLALWMMLAALRPFIAFAMHSNLFGQE